MLFMKPAATNTGMTSPGAPGLSRYGSAKQVDSVVGRVVVPDHHPPTIPEPA